jgi:hypothetical protein
MKKKSGDGMVRVDEHYYEMVHLYCAQKRLNIKDVASEAFREWADKHIDKNDRKIIEQIMNKNKNE